MEYFNEDQKFFTRIFWLYVILAFCFLQKNLRRYEHYFKLQQPEKPVKEEIVVQGLDLSDKTDAEQAQILQNLEEEQHRNQLAIYEYESCIRNCLWFRNEVAMVFVFMHGVSLTMFLCLVVMFVKNNLSSILYLIAVFQIYRVEYYPSRFQSTLDKPDQVDKRDRVNRSLRRLITLTSILILIEYSFITIHNFTAKAEEQSFKFELISGWSAFIEQNLCFLKEEPLEKGQETKCVHDWNNWLEFGKESITGSFFVSQYFLLMVAYFARHFTSTENEGLNEIKILPEPVYGDEKDFTSIWNPNASSPDEANSSDKNYNTDADIQSEHQQEQQPKISLTEKISYYSEKILDLVAFQLFPYILLSVIFLTVIRFDGVSFADLIDIGFLIQCFFLLVQIKGFYAKNIKMLTTLRRYNMIVLAVLVFYQAPLFLCPAHEPVASAEAGAASTEARYVPAAECLPETISRESGTAPWLTFYVVVA